MSSASREETKHQDRRSVTQEDVEIFDKVRSQMKTLAVDLEALSKKSPDAPVSKFKVTFINEMLRNANQLLISPFKPIEGFEVFDEAALPSSSDSLMVLNQYLTCLERWRSAHSHSGSDVFHSLVWNIPDELITSEPPTT